MEGNQNPNRGVRNISNIGPISHQRSGKRYERRFWIETSIDVNAVEGLVEKTTAPLLFTTVDMLRKMETLSYTTRMKETT